jgi:hypothetical protein
MGNSPENLSLPIPNEILRPYIETAVSTAIVSALGDGTALVQKAVQGALSQKVDEKGRISQYSSDNKHLFVEVVAAENIRNIAKETIKEMAEQIRPQIKEQVTQYLKDQTSEISRSLVDGLIESLQTDWSVKVSIGRHV